MYHDLLGVPYKLHGRLPTGLDCSTLAEEVLTRLGMSPPSTSPFRIPNSSGALEEFEAYLEAQAQSIQRLGDTLSLATQPGDLILTSGAAARGMWVVAEPGCFLTAQPRVGVRAADAATVIRSRPSILGVYRCIP